MPYRRGGKDTKKEIIEGRLIIKKKLKKKGRGGKKKENVGMGKEKRKRLEKKFLDVEGREWEELNHKYSA